jgi:uncharacterized alpha-E superfamily protein
MLSRVADNLYWFSRYLRRAENTARLVNVNSQLQLDLPRSVRFDWQPLVTIVGAQDLFDELYDSPIEANVVRFMLVDERNPYSMIGSVQRARDNLRSIRDILPQETWEQLNTLYLELQAGGERGLARRYRVELLTRVINGCLLMSGTLTATVSRDVGFQFLRLGTALEQADMTTRIIDAGGAGLIRAKGSEDLAPFQSMQWMSVLRSLAAYHMFRRHVRERIAAPQALRFLLQNREFPRAVSFCLTRAMRTLSLMPPRINVDRAISRVLALTNDADADAIAAEGPGPLMDEIQVGLDQLNAAIGEAYFRG